MFNTATSAPSLSIRRIASAWATEPPALTRRESQVLDLLLQGFQNKAVGARLGISCRTVEAHRARLYQKLGVRNGAALGSRVAQLGLRTFHQEWPQ